MDRRNIFLNLQKGIKFDHKKHEKEMKIFQQVIKETKLSK